MSNITENTSTSTIVNPNTEIVDIEQNIKSYVSEHSPHLFILSPFYGGMCHVNYMINLMNTQDLLRYFKIEVTIRFMQNDSLITRARNNLVAKAMACPTMTHCMFIDSDITWSPIDLIKLIISNKELIGGIYPLKQYEWQRLLPTPDNPNPIQSLFDKRNTSQFNGIFNDVDYIQHKLLKYNVNYKSNDVKIVNNMAQVKHIATGFMMFKRTTIQKMFDAYPETKYSDDVNGILPSENEFAYALFDCGIVNKHYYSEDWMFCHRWAELQGEIWVDIGINLTHSGNEHYNGSMVTTFIPH